MDESLERELRLEQDWKHYELYEKVRIRERRKKIFWITLALACFSALASIPVVQTQLPKWKTYAQIRVLAIKVEKLKTQVIQNKQAMRLEFKEHGLVEFQEVSQCTKAAKVLRVTETFSWKVNQGQDSELVLLSPEQAEAYRLDGVYPDFCFDPIRGLGLVKQLFVVVPAKDLTDLKMKEKNSQLSRASFLLLQGDDALATMN